MAWSMGCCAGHWKKLGVASRGMAGRDWDRLGRKTILTLALNDPLKMRNGVGPVTQATVFHSVRGTLKHRDPKKLA